MTSVCRTITGGAVAAPFQADIVRATADAVPRPKLVGLLATDSAPSRSYAEWTAKACAAVGIEYEMRLIGAAGATGESTGETAAGDGDKSGESSATPTVTDPIEVESAILAANADPSVHGIIVYYPIFGPTQDGYLQQAVSPLKDVEGLNFTWRFSMYHNQRFIDPAKLAGAAGVLSAGAGAEAAADPSATGAATEAVPAPHSVKAILPCTPLAMVKILEYCQVYNALLPYGSRLFGRTITVINRSEVVGRPLAALLANDGARVFSVDLDGIQEFSRRTVDETAQKASFLPFHQIRPTSKTLAECLAVSDVVISGVPSKAYKVDSALLKEGVVAINFSESKNFDGAIKDKASLYVPGVGKVTIAMLQRNLLRLYGYSRGTQGPSEEAK